MNNQPPPFRNGGGLFVQHLHTGPGPLAWTIFAVLLALLLVALISLLLGIYHRSQPAQAAGEEPPPGGALEVLDTRYAGGELSRKDYLQIRKDLLRT